MLSPCRKRPSAIVLKFSLLLAAGYFFLDVSASSLSSCRSEDNGFSEVESLAAVVKSDDSVPTFEEENDRYRQSPALSESDPSTVTGRKWMRVGCIAKDADSVNSVGYLGTDSTYFQGFNLNGLPGPGGHIEQLEFLLGKKNRSMDVKIAVSHSKIERQAVVQSSQAGWRGRDEVRDRDLKISYPSATDVNFQRTLYYSEKSYDPVKNLWFQKPVEERYAGWEFRCKKHPGDAKVAVPRLICEVVYYCYDQEFERSMTQRPVDSFGKLVTYPRSSACRLNRQTIGYCSYIAPEKKPIFADFKVQVISIQRGSS